MKSKRVAGVSVNTENPPKKEQLLKSILNTPKYQNDASAIPEINAEIKRSGLYSDVTAKPDKGSKPADAAKPN